MTFEAVYEHQYPHVHKFCFSKLGNRADAEEVTQEAFLRLLKSWGKHELRNGGAGLLIQMAKWLIQGRKRPLLPLMDISVRHKFHDPLPARLLDMIWQLPRLQRRAVVMHYYADMTFEEIGEAMGTGISTAEYRTKAGIRRLRRAII